jgi:hypothetical protein
MAYKAIDIAKKIVCKTDVEHGDFSCKTNPEDRKYKKL